MCAAVLLAAAAALHQRMGQRCWLAAEVERDRARAVAELGDDDLARNASRMTVKWDGCPPSNRNGNGGAG